LIEQGASLGLLGMRERVVLLAGELDCKSAPAALWLIVCIAQKKNLTSEKSGHNKIGDGLGLPQRRKRDGSSHTVNGLVENAHR
jgi:hypothetical protein